MVIYNNEYKTKENTNCTTGKIEPKHIHCFGFLSSFFDVEETHLQSVRLLPVITSLTLDPAAQV